MACSNCGGDKRTYIEDGDGITFSGAGTKTAPYKPHLAVGATALALEVRDSPTVNFTLYGSGLPGDPLILTADTASAAKLVNLGDVAATPAPAQGRAPVWIGTPTGGHFELRSLGTRYTTHATRGDGLYQGEQIRETDTGERLEWDGSQYVSIQPSSVAPSALDPSVLQNKGTIDGSVNWNSLVNGSGIYRVQDGINSGNASPVGAYGYGTLHVTKSGNSVTQEYFTHQSGRVYSRTKWNDADFSGWSMSASFADVQNVSNDRANGDNNLQNQINAEAGARTNRDNDLYNDYTARINGLSSSIDGGRLDGRYPLKIASAGRIQSGEAVVTNFAKDSDTGRYFGYLDIGYGAFNGSPRVVVTAQSADAGGVTCTVQNRGSGGCRVYVSRRNNVDTGILWVAVGD